MNGKEIQVTADQVAGRPARTPRTRWTWCSSAPACSPSARRPRGTSRRARRGAHLRAGEGPGHHRRLRHQPRASYDPAKHKIISNASCTTNCLAPVAEGPARELRHQARPDDDHPLLHQRPEPARPAAQGPAPRARRRAVDDPVDHRRREGGRRGDPGAQGQAARHRGARPDARTSRWSTSPWSSRRPPPPRRSTRRSRRRPRAR